MTDVANELVRSSHLDGKSKPFEAGGVGSHLSVVLLPVRKFRMNTVRCRAGESTHLVSKIYAQGLEDPRTPSQESKCPVSRVTVRGAERRLVEFHSPIRRTSISSKDRFTDSHFTCHLSVEDQLLELGETPDDGRVKGFRWAPRSAATRAKFQKLGTRSMDTFQVCEVRPPKTTYKVRLPKTTTKIRPPKLGHR